MSEHSELNNTFILGVFYKLAWGDFEAIMQQKSLMNEGAMRASTKNIYHSGITLMYDME